MRSHSHMTRMLHPHELIPIVLEDLRLARPIDLPAVVVTAHPDDEILGMGGRLRKFKSLTLMQLTDGAPLWEADAKRLGFANRTAYAAAREDEARKAVAALGLDCRRIRFGAPDQGSMFFAPELLRLLQRELCGAALVFTHPYEGGHPDHDLAALVVQYACDQIRWTGVTPPARLEFASYHHRDDRLVAGQFWPDPGCTEAIVALKREAQARKRRALAEYRTQSEVIAWFPTAEERYRAAPCYDFSKPPPPKIAQYDLFGRHITSLRWRHTVASLLSSAGETPSCGS